MDAINLNHLAYFAAVAETGSFTRAAERLGVTKTVVSQQITRLEADLKTSLLLRTTRRVEPTEAGRRLHARCVTIFREAEAAVSEILQANAEPIGVLRIAAPHDYGSAMIAPIAAAFTRRYPACAIDLVLSDDRIDPIAHHIDLSVRVGWLEDSDNQARRIGSFRQLLVAAPDVAATIRPDAPESLSSAAFVAVTALSEPHVWRFARGESEVATVRMRKRLSVSSAAAALSAILAGGGLAVLPDFHLLDHLAAGRLVHVLPSWELPSGGIYVVYPAARFRPPKVTAFVAMLMEGVRRSKKAS